MDKIISIYFVALIVIIAIWLILRELICWYYKINKRISLQMKTNELLEELIKNSKQNTNEPAKSESIKSTVKIDNIEVSKEDIEDQMSWDSAMDRCNSLSDGWRLPTIEELNILFQNKDTIGSFDTSKYYWSSTEDAPEKAWCQGFGSGKQGAYPKNSACKIRPVKSI